MEFPITRERLKNYRANEAISVETKQRVLKEIQEICKQVEKTVISTNERKYIYRISSLVRYGPLRQTTDVRLGNPDDILKELLVAIKNTFPDSMVVVDPLESYILIDWS